MKTYRVHMEHWQRRLGAPHGSTFIERLEVVVEASTGDAAAKAARALLPEWTIRVVLVEAVAPRETGEWQKGV